MPTIAFEATWHLTDDPELGRLVTCPVIEALQDRGVFPCKGFTVDWPPSDPKTGLPTAPTVRIKIDAPEEVIAKLEQRVGTRAR